MTWNIKIFIQELFCVAGLFLLWGCRGENTPAFDDGLRDVADAMAYGEYEHAQQLCDRLFDAVCGVDSSAVTEAQAARLGILYMKLSEHRYEDENVAEATQCFRYALRLSADSLKAFAAGLPLEDERHFVLLRRIGLSIDNPVDLADGDMGHGDYADGDSIQ